MHFCLALNSKYHTNQWSPSCSAPGAWWPMEIEHWWSMDLRILYLMRLNFVQPPKSISCRNFSIFPTQQLAVIKIKIQTFDLFLNQTDLIKYKTGCVNRLWNSTSTQNVSVGAAKKELMQKQRWIGRYLTHRCMVLYCESSFEGPVCNDPVCARLSGDIRHLTRNITLDRFKYIYTHALWAPVKCGISPMWITRSKFTEQRESSSLAKRKKISRIYTARGILLAKGVVQSYRTSSSFFLKRRCCFFNTHTASYKIKCLGHLKFKIIHKNPLVKLVKLV